MRLCFAVAVVVAIAISTVSGSSRCNSDSNQRGSSGTFATKNYPRNYDSRSNCQWSITVPSNKDIKITFHGKFELEKGSFSGRCYDVVKIYNGPSTSSREIGAYCGKSAPSPITVSGNQAFITFKSDSSVGKAGFRIQWRAISKTSTSSPSSGCGSPSVQSGTGGVISSKNYPLSYTRRLACKWTITVPSNKQIKLTFSSAFEIEKGISSGRCYDKLSIYSGSSSSSSSKIGSYCGNTAPSPVYVRDNNAYITFTTDGSSQKKGFRITWSAVSRTSGSSSSGSSGCSSAKLQSGNSGSFSSMNYPQDYERRADCSWVITVPFNKFIKLTFNSQFKLEKGSSSGKCYDALKVYSGSSRSQKIGTYCGSSAPSPIIVESNVAHVTFTSDSSVVYKGFRVSWSAVSGNSGSESGCGSPKSQSGSSGSVSSMNYPRSYDSSANCEWEINAAARKYIRLTFGSTFGLEKGAITGKCYDVVKVYNSDTLVGSYCGASPPSSLVVPSNSARITFKSDRSVQKSGFRINWTAISRNSDETAANVPSGCDSPKAQVGISGSFASKNYPSRYDSSLNCQWRIRVPSGKNIAVQFSPNFHVEKSSSSSKCFDSVTVYRGNSASGSKLNSFCGTQVPAPFVIRGNNAVVVFKSDGSLRYTGFKIYWRAVSGNTVPPTLPPTQSGCGGAYQLNFRGSFASQRSGVSKYGNNQYCSWLLKVPLGYKVQLKFTSFNLEGSSSKCRDKVKVFNGASPYERQIGGELCRDRIPAVLESTGNEMFVMFQTDYSVTKSGFKAQFKKIR